jgi:hypothetical protein
MSKIWTKQEEAALTAHMGTRRVLYKRDKLAIHKLLPNRSPAAIEKRWGIMLKRRDKPMKSLLNPAKQRELNHQLSRQLDMLAIAKTPPAQETVATLFIKELRAAGLRGRVAIDLGD